MSHKIKQWFLTLFVKYALTVLSDQLKNQNTPAQPNVTPSWVLFCYINMEITGDV